MEFFKQTNIDWLGKSKYFFGLSLILLLAGAASLYKKGGPAYGIDFKGGTLVYVRFAQAPPIEQIRAALAAEHLGESTIQETRDFARPNANEVVIGLEQIGDETQSIDRGKAAILAALQKTFGKEGGKPDFNAAAPASLTEALTRRDPLNLGSAGVDRYPQLAKNIASYKNVNKGGLLTNFDELATVEGSSPAVVAALKENYSLGTFAIRDSAIVGPKVGAQLRQQAVLATLYALAGMLVYIAFRFEWVYGTAAVLAVFHDVLITLGFFSIFNFEISLTVIAALLTLVGYSMNDTIVIFDRIRENLRIVRREPLAVVANRSINQTLSRTILTSGLTFITAFVLFVMGGQVLRSFSFALVIGIVVGTYSSFGIAVPLVVMWHNWRGQQQSVTSTAR
ncbi:MAG: protein translocase subunit SecF [Acidobacteria bacterium]|nr:protein translocase subunit SecF [Acidobacteriota bacterium]